MKILAFVACYLFIAFEQTNSQSYSNSLSFERREQSQLIKETSDSLIYINPFEIVVTAPRLSLPVKETPLAVTVVGADVLRAMPRSIAVDEPLKLVPGVKVDNQADGERVHTSIRGQGILSEHGLRGIKAILDGLPLNDPTGFTPDLYDVDWATIEKIEVLRGLASSLHGCSAAAGVLNILTKNGRNGPLNGDISTMYGTRNFWKLLGQLGATVDEVNYRISLSRMMGDGYRIHTKYWANNFYGKLRWQPREGITITPTIGYTDFFNQNAEGLNLQQVKTNPRMANPDAEPMNEYMKTSRLTAGATAHFSFDKKHEIVSNVFTRGTKYIEAVPKSVLHRTMDSPGFSFQYKIHFDQDFWKNTVSLGSDVQWQEIDQYRYPNLGDAKEGDSLLAKDLIKQRGIGVFVLDRLEFGKEWGVSLMVRKEDMHNELTDNLQTAGVDLSGSADFQKTTASFGVTFTPSSAINFYANWGQGFLPPATEELALNPDAQGGFNTHLIPATSQGEEIGFRGSFRRNLYGEVALFYFTTDNDFDRYRISSRPLETFYRNSGSTRRFGLELYSQWMPVNELKVQAAYTYSNFKYTITSRPQILMDDPNIIKYIEKGNWLPNSPAHQLYLDIQTRVLPSLILGLSIEALSRAYIDGANIIEEAVEGYGLVHARAAYQLAFDGTNLELTLSIRNLFNKLYIAFTEPDPGGNSYQPGAKRAILGGMRVML